MGYLCIVILSLTDQIMEQDKKIRDLKDVQGLRYKKVLHEISIKLGYIRS